jgi:hypothetical protein
MSPAQDITVLLHLYNSYEYSDCKYQCSGSGDVSFCTDPDPLISKKKDVCKKNLDFYSFATS